MSIKFKQRRRSEKKHKEHHENVQNIKTNLNFNLKSIIPITDTQVDAYRAYEKGHNLLMIGCSGTGKSFIASYLALKDVLDSGNTYHKLIIIRSAVPGRVLGHLPGVVQEKINVYEAPHIAMVNEIFGRGDAWEICLRKGVINFISTSYLRGSTLNNAVVLVDEIQNCTAQELETVITRVGKNCKIMFCGDINQNDLYRSKNDTSGLPNFLQIVENMSSFDVINFGLKDIVRSGICREFLEAKYKIENLVLQKSAAA